MTFSLELGKYTMSEILLVAVNACYNHTNLAIRSISQYISDKNVSFGEWTINQPEGDILRGIAESEPKLIIFSTYIWNIELIQKIIVDLKKVLPDCIIGAGGPEAGYSAGFYLKKLKELDFIVFGEGEETTKEVAEAFLSNPEFKKNPYNELRKIPGLYIPVRDDENSSAQIEFTGERPLLCSLDEIPFAYPQITDPDNRIYYYESSRGCPFTCAYCMSSLDKKVRFISLERTFKDIQRFLDAGVRLVKFVDRTFNLNEERYIAIWEYILSHHNGKTMFHFEIEAEFLTDKALDFLQNVPAGIMQFEIGVQSSNRETLKAVGRSENTEKLAYNIKRIPKTIHSHLDLIAGLPYENLEIFGKSFDYVMDFKPDALQLGFLKVLHGTQMEAYSQKNGWKWMENPPYETLCTPYLSYRDILFLKDVEKLVDAYWNKGSFETTMNYIFAKLSPWEFFCSFVNCGRKEGAFVQPRKEQYWFEFIARLFKREEFSGFDCKTALELLRFDFVKQGKKGGFPEWYDHHYDKEAHRTALEQNGALDNTRIAFSYSEYEEFAVNPFAPDQKNDSGTFKFLFFYPRGNCDSTGYRQILL